MSVNSQWRLFLNRRIHVPVRDEDLVLDVGSGDKPSWRADVLLDRYAGAEHSAQRSGRSSARVTRPLFDADAAHMPFADGAFDYAICSNLLEHVTDPLGVANELTRVARAGFIEVPEAASAKIVDFPSHLWWCRFDETDPDAPTLVMTAKTTPYFDAEIDAYIERAGVRQALDDVLYRRMEHRAILYHWSGAVRLRTEGQLDPDFAAAAMMAPGHKRTWEAIAVRWVTSVLTARTRMRRRWVRVRYNQVVKPEFRRADDPILERRIYRVGDPS
ncbi:methyltransferase domain-containing protein [Nocardioides sp. CGMCC 1.13656]|uniref:class I SAM-dependent methyltransferase n=1 Tax=Nocardioides TaxID=1839 RepID=UPI0012F778F3|nr:methyltransferase domain-containing protein [Nocardioides sp. CGMCC 1.13656]MBA2952377.1 methyltransferase domain-containing protein [Nocardioides sp. CGMCC 1.13656]